MERWCGKVAVVTGSSSGIGAAIAISLAKAGMKVVGLARRVEKTQTIADNLKQEGCPGILHAIKCDMRKEEEIKAAFAWTIAHLGPVHVLINNAGTLQPTNLVDGDTEKWRTMLETNLLGLSIATREALQNMMANNVHGHIIHINSIAGQMDIYVPTLPMYGATKHGLRNLTALLRKELLALEKTDIKVTSISPGAVETEIFDNDSLPEDTRKAFMEMPQLKSQDVADAVLYILGVPHSVHVYELTICPTGSVF